MLVLGEAKPCRARFHQLAYGPETGECQRRLAAGRESQLQRVRQALQDEVQRRVDSRVYVEVLVVEDERLWLTRCQEAAPPPILATPETADLTPREREIALIAAAGSSSREIAERL